VNLEQIMAAVDELSPEDRERPKEYLSQPQSKAPQPKTVEEWLALFEDIAREFRGDSTDEEMKEIIEAMTMKSRPC
jgi:hypothetical protein